VYSTRVTSFVTRTLSADFITPVRAYSTIYKLFSERSSFLFESVVPGERWGRYSIIGCLPQTEKAYDRDPLAELGREMAQEAEPATLLETLSRSRAGYIAYEAVNSLHHIADWNDKIPDAWMMSGCTILLFDNVNQTLSVGGPVEATVERCIREITTPGELDPIPIPRAGTLPEHVDVTIDDAAYGEKVLRAKEYIAAGDVFQVVLARRFTVPIGRSDPFDVYRALRVLSPSPYLYFLHVQHASAGRIDIAGASPETMVRHQGGRMTLRPIAGTRPRGASDDEDRRLAEELMADPKERAEHVMLVDLARNDAGRVCTPGSVTLTQNMAVERYSHVMHIVSEVTGTPRPGTDPGNILKAAFPAGTLTGAPKVRATQIIRELENEPRKCYGGAIGYLMPGGAFDLAIAIRTVVAQDGFYRLTAGAGIVEGSDPAAEAQETRNKARAGLTAIRAAQDASAARVRST
jgi:anthranilate synthase component I